MMLKTPVRVVLRTLILGAVLTTAAFAQDQRKPPYWASIAAGEAMMRTGPGTNYPATWLYRRRDLPIRVVEVHSNWRKVSDPGGETGWIMVSLLSSTRTAFVQGDEPQPIHKAPTPDADVVYRAQPGVVGRISRCDDGWCRIDVGGRIGHIRTEHIWGLDPDEEID